MATRTSQVSPDVSQKRKVYDKDDEVFNEGKRRFGGSDIDIELQRSDGSQRSGTAEASSIGIGYKDAEIKRLNLLLNETQAKAITLANLVHVPTTTIEQLPALIQSITNYLKFNIVPYTANAEIDAARDQVVEHDTEVVEKEGHKALEKESQKTKQAGEELIGSAKCSTVEDIEKEFESEGEETDNKSVRGDEEYWEIEVADRDTDDDIESLRSNSHSKQEDVSSQAGLNLSLVHNSGHKKGRGGPRSTRKYANRLARVGNTRAKKPARFQVYHQKQILLSPEPEEE